MLVLVLGPALAYGCDSSYGAEVVATDAGDASTGDAGIEDVAAPAEDAAADAAPACDPTKPFGIPKEVAGLSTPEHEGTARLTPDELTVYFSAIRSAAAFESDLYIATRTATTAPFTGETRLAGASTKFYAETHPMGSADRLRVVFARLVNGTWQIHGASRLDAGGPFDSFIEIPVSFPGDDASLQPYVLADGLYFTTFAVDAGSRTKIRRAPVVGDGFGVAVSLPELDSSSGECNPTVTADELTIYFCSDRPAAGAKGKYDLYVARRATKSEPFTSIKPIEELNTSADEFPNWISADGCRLYFASDRVRGDGSADIYVAERGR